MSNRKGERTRITVRLPAVLHALLVIEAERRDISVNDLIVETLLNHPITQEGTMNAFNLICPECGSHSHLNVEVRTWVHLLPNGVDIVADTEWNGDHDAVCTSCNWTGKVAELKEV